VKIGNVILPDQPVFLAPMEDITDRSFRFICKEHGVDAMISEFVASEGLIRDCEKSQKKMNVDDFERPFGIQIYGHLIKSMVEAARMAEKNNPDFIDLNFGCPARKVAGKGAGAGLLKDIPLMVEMTKAVVETTNLPVTVKTRLGWDEEHIQILDITKSLQDMGIDAITIHGRTKSQMYRGKANWDRIAEVKNDPEVTIPVIGNGDIDSPQAAQNAFEQFDVDGIMIGRAAVGRPWLFSMVKEYLETGKMPQEPTVEEKADIARRHFLHSVEWKGEPRGIFEMRKHLSNYFKGLPHFKPYRMKLVKSLDKQEILDTLKEIAEKYSGFDSSQLKHDSFFHY